MLSPFERFVVTQAALQAGATQTFLKHPGQYARHCSLSAKRLLAKAAALQGLDAIERTAKKSDKYIKLLDGEEALATQLKPACKVLAQHDFPHDPMEEKKLMLVRHNTNMSIGNAIRAGFLKTGIQVNRSDGEVVVLAPCFLDPLVAEQKRSEGIRQGRPATTTAMVECRGR